MIYWPAVGSYTLTTYVARTLVSVHTPSYDITVITYCINCRRCPSSILHSAAVCAKDVGYTLVSGEHSLIGSCHRISHHLCLLVCCIYSYYKKQKNLSEKQKNLGMACHTPPLKKVKKQGKMPLPSLGPIPLKSVEFRDATPFGG